MKPLIKPKSKFKEKIKNFFHFDMDEVTKEEEPQKVFEKIPLINLTRNKIFLGIFLFLVIVNILVGFGIDFLYIRAILGFLFLVIVPGLLIMLCFKIKTVKFWEFLVYTIGLSIAFIMFAGLIVNWTLPALNITNKPLSLYPILICFDIFLVALGIVGWKRNKDFPPFQFTVPKLDTINNIFFIIPMAFPVLSILGAFLLNNHGSNILTMILLGSIAVYVLLLVIFRKKMNENVWPWALLFISVSILLSGWLRSWFISGVDINLEYGLFQLTQHNGFWGLYNLGNGYDAMLSVTILPTIFSMFTQINDNFILKLFYPTIFSFLPLIIYLILRKHFKNIICFLSVFFFISQYDFITWMTIPIRQEIAFTFFGLTLLILFTTRINLVLKKGLFLIFGISMTVSHYSTTYIALAIFILTYFITFFYKQYEKKKRKKEKIPSTQKSEFYLTGALVLLLFLFGFLWYNQVTPTSDGLIDFISKSANNLGNMLSEEVQAEGGSVLDQFKIFNKEKDLSIRLNQYTEGYSKNFIAKNPNLNLYPPQLYMDYKTSLKSSNFLPYQINSSGIFVFSYIKELLKFVLEKALILLGAFFLIFYFRKNKKLLRYLFMTISFLSILFIIIILPFATISYNLDRAYQQILIFLSLPCILGSLLVFNILKKKQIFIWITMLFVIYFLFLSGFIGQLTGGQDISMALNNLGTNYDMYFSHMSEIYSGNWLKQRLTSKETIDIEGYGASKLYLSSLKFRFSKDVLPSLLGRKDYVYSSYANSNEEIAFKSYYGNILPITFPHSFLNNNKNKIYNNGGSEIFK